MPKNRGEKKRTVCITLSLYVFGNIDKERGMITRSTYVQNLLINARLLALFGVSAWIIQMLIGCQGDECGFFIFLIELLRIIPMDNSCMKDEKLMELEQRLKVLEGRGDGMGIDKLTWAD